MARLELQLFGGFRMRDGRGDSIHVSSTKACAMLAYLGAEPPSSARRDTLASLLWGESAPENARASLRQALYVLRKALPPGILESNRHLVSLSEAATTVDVREFRRLAESSELEPLRSALELYRGPLLEGLDIRIRAFEDWSLSRRRRLRERILRVADRLATSLIEVERLRDAVSVRMRSLEIDPTNEAAHRELMRLYAWLDRRGDAVRQFHRCREVLERELGLAPSRSTWELYARLQESR